MGILSNEEIYSVEHDDSLVHYSTDGDLDKVKKYFNKGVSRDGYVSALANASQMGNFDIVKYLLNNGDNPVRDVAVATKWASEGYRVIENRNLQLYLMAKKITLHRHFTLQKRYEVV